MGIPCDLTLRPEITQFLIEHAHWRVKRTAEITSVVANIPTMALSVMLLQACMVELPPEWPLLPKSR